jgi:CDP-diacylglycerol--glycerol-3-phosphate 3-phosphatidyltransferase
MNLPNKLTLLRVFLVPAFVVLVLYREIPYHYLWAFLVFAGASLTDRFDGKIAREQNLITNFGKFLDPLADKVLVISALVCFLPLGLVNVWCVLLIIARELMVTSIRLLALESDGVVISANKWGKAKTISQMVAIIFVLLCQSLQEFFSFSGGSAAMLAAGDVLLWIATALTVISGAIYLKENLHLINASK